MHIIKNLGIIGAGLIGGSIARAARRHNAASHITIIEADAEHAREAQELGLGDVCTQDISALQNCDLVILATSVACFPALAKVLTLKPGAILSDVASVKGATVAAIRPYLSSNVQFIPGHPIAGTEHSGLRAGFADLFQTKWTILTPLPDTDAVALETLKTFWEAIGAHVAIMDVEQHDKAFATTSHLPHAIAFSLMQLAEEQADAQGHEILQFAANSFGDYTRVAASDPALWLDIFMHNKDALRASLSGFKAKIEAVEHWLEQTDGEALEEFIAGSRRARKALDAFKEKGVKGY